ncbi:MAG: 6-phosphogluconolactonase [Propionibacteriaceae bacterium]|jgi:6-phosphogluconolactonase|nr:6-phosphogluconolactonase [Propionibacteriaceae bacterium]
MTPQRLLRFEDRPSLVARTAALLLDDLCVRQARNGSVSLCLTGGTLANEVYDEVAVRLSNSPLRAGDLHLWWNWDYFIATDNPDRNSLQALSRLGGALTLDPAKIHPIPSSSVSSDPEAAAAQYAQDLAENAPIDLCLLELSPLGGVAGIFPSHLDPPTAAVAAGITDAPLPYPELVTLTRAGLNACREIWILAAGETIAPALGPVLHHDLALPASHLTGAETLLWLADTAALAAVPFHRCTL